MLACPAETGKTYACCEKVHRLCMAYPNTQAAIVRKTYQAMPGSVLQTFARVIEGSGVSTYGAAKPQWYDYRNGSRVWVGGMDHPDKVLSSERDFIYVNQAEELELADWETLRTRATGRAGHVPHPQVIGDCNPGVPTHWIKASASAGALPLLESRHEDNPTLFDPETGEITEQGKLSLSILDQLTGPRKARLRYGQWAGAEGMVYEESWDSGRNVVDAFPIPGDWPRYLAIDFGFTNPFACQWWAEDGDGRLYLYREIYHTQRLVEDHARQIKQLSERVEYGYTNHKVKTHTGEEALTKIVLVRDKSDKFTWSFATNMTCEDSYAYIGFYKRRWRIETNFRVEDEAKIKSKSVFPIIRYFYFLISLLLRAIWLVFRKEIPFKSFLIKSYKCMLLENFGIYQITTC